MLRYRAAPRHTAAFPPRQQKPRDREDGTPSLRPQHPPPRGGSDKRSNNSHMNYGHLRFACCWHIGASIGTSLSRSSGARVDTICRGKVLCSVSTVRGGNPPPGMCDRLFETISPTMISPPRPRTLPSCCAQPNGQCAPGHLLLHPRSAVFKRDLRPRHAWPWT